METRENLIAYEIAKQACLLAKSIQGQFQKRDSLEKRDKTPVTIADYAIQVLITKILQHSFKRDAIIAEETPEALVDPENFPLLQEVQEALRTLFPKIEKREVVDLLRAARRDVKGIDRYWVVDPIDGTKGFLRGEQYAIALALVDDKVTRLGILGCPSYDSHGTIFAAERGRGAKAVSLADGRSRQLRVAMPNSPEEIVLCTSYESRHIDDQLTEKLLSSLKAVKMPIKSDGQGKYGLVASGKAHLFLRIPKDRSYREKIWDHRAGELIVGEAGGVVTDLFGNKLECSEGDSFSDSIGVMACHPNLHAQVTEAISRVV